MGRRPAIPTPRPRRIRVGQRLVVRLGRGHRILICLPRSNQAPPLRNNQHPIHQPLRQARGHPRHPRRIRGHHRQRRLRRPTLIQMMSMARPGHPPTLPLRHYGISTRLTNRLLCPTSNLCRTITSMGKTSTRHHGAGIHKRSGSSSRTNTIWI